MIRRADAHAENCWPTVDCDSTRANPFFDFAARSNAGAREHFLYSLSFFATLLTPATPALALLLIVVLFLSRRSLVHLLGFGGIVMLG